MGAAGAAAGLAGAGRLLRLRQVPRHEVPAGSRATAPAGKARPAHPAQERAVSRVRPRHRALAQSALLAEFDPDGDYAEDEGGGWGGGDGSDYDSDDNSTAAQMHRHFSKMEMLGIPIPGARDMGDDSD